MPAGEIDAIAKAFPHIRARDARMALRELPELRASGLGEERLDLLFRLVERLDGLPRHIAVHPCGVLLSDATLLDRTPVEASYAGFPMSQFDKDDVEDLGLLKLDVLGIRMQSAMAHAVAEIERVDGVRIDLDDEAQVPFDDDRTFPMISQAEDPRLLPDRVAGPARAGRQVRPRDVRGHHHRHLAVPARAGQERHDHALPRRQAGLADAALPARGPAADPRADPRRGGLPRAGHRDHRAVHRLQPAEADEARRALGDVEGMAEAKLWFFPRAMGRGYSRRVVEEVWKVLEAFASFGFCKAHAAAFALPTYQSAWLKAHYPAHFLAGVLTHDPGMYPKRLILDDARQLGIAVLGLDVNASEKTYVVERVETSCDEPGAGPACPTEFATSGRGYGIRLALSEVKGISEAEVDRIVAARPYHSLTDFWHRARVSRPVVERLVLAGGFDGVYGIGGRPGGGVRRRGTVTRRDLLLQVADLDRHARRSTGPPGRGRGPGRAAAVAAAAGRPRRPRPARAAATAAAASDQGSPTTWSATRAGSAPGSGSRRRGSRRRPGGRPGHLGPARPRPRRRPGRRGGQRAAGDGRLRAGARRAGDPRAGRQPARGRLLRPFLDALGVTRSADLLRSRSKSELLVAGVKVATQTPPIRSGRRVVFLTLDDATGPVDATFFEDAQGPYAATVFHSWLLVVRGELRRTGRRGVSLRATGCWELPALHEVWQRGGLDAVGELMAEVPAGFGRAGQDAVQGPRRAGPPGRWWPGPPRRRRPRRPPVGWAGAGCWCTPAASRCRPTPTSSRPARTPRAQPAIAPRPPQALALLAGELRWLARRTTRDVH